MPDQRRISAFFPCFNDAGTIAEGSTSITVNKFTVTSVPLSVTGGTLQIEVPEKGDVVVSGNGLCVTDLNRAGRVLKLYADPKGPEALHGRGAVRVEDGRVESVRKGGQQHPAAGLDPQLAVQRRPGVPGRRRLTLASNHLRSLQGAS